MSIELHTPSDINPIPSMHELAADGQVEAEKEYLRTEISPRYLQAIAEARELDEDDMYDREDEKPQLVDFNNLDDYATALAAWMPRYVENTDLDYRKQLDLGHLGHPNNLKCWFMTEGTYDVENSEKSGIGMLRAYRAKEPRFWTRCEAQVAHHQQTSRAFEEALRYRETLKQATVNSTKALAEAEDSLAKLEVLNIVESWITDRFMVDVIEDMLEANLTTNSADNEVVYSRIETLFT